MGLRLTKTFLSDAPDHIREGVIRLKPRAVTIAGLLPDRYTGDTRQDKALLRTILNRATFPMTEYDTVLERVGRIGFGLEVDDEEDPRPLHRQTQRAPTISHHAPLALAAAIWLAELRNGRNKDFRPCVVTIDGDDWPAVAYTRCGEYEAGMMGVTQGKRKAGEPYEDRRIYVIGLLPRSYLKRRKTCYLWGEETWYVAGYYHKEYLRKRGWEPLTPEAEKEYNPFGEHFMLGHWNHKDPIDDDPDHPYTRRPMAVTYVGE